MTDTTNEEGRDCGECGADTTADAHDIEYIRCPWCPPPCGHCNMTQCDGSC